MSLVIDNIIVSPHNIASKFFHFSQYIFLEVVPFCWISIIQVALKLRVRELIGWLKFLVILRFTLDSIVCEMNKKIVKVLEVKVLTTCANISFTVPVSFQKTIHTCKEEIMSYIKFTVIVQKWSINVRLNNICEWLPILMLCLLELILN